MDVPIAANTLGTVGAICWSVQLIPQIIINYRRHHAEGLQPSMMMLWAWAGIPLGVYNIIRDFNIALQIQPQILTTLSLITWVQCGYYQKKWTVAKCLSVAVPLAIFMGAVEVALIFALSAARYRNLEWPLILMAVFSAALLATGVLTHYVDIYRHRTVRGISFIFVGIDAAGDLFSLLSIFFQPELDILGIVIYASELALWIGVMACGVCFNFLPRLRSGAGQESEEVDRVQHASLPDAGIALHDQHSSTSVFRTPTGSLVSRSITTARQSHNACAVSTAVI